MKIYHEEAMGSLVAIMVGAHSLSHDRRLPKGNTAELISEPTDAEVDCSLADSKIAAILLTARGGVAGYLIELDDTPILQGKLNRDRQLALTIFDDSVTFDKLSITASGTLSLVAICGDDLTAAEDPDLVDVNIYSITLAGGQAVPLDVDVSAVSVTAVDVNVVRQN